MEKLIAILIALGLIKGNTLLSPMQDEPPPLYAYSSTPSSTFLEISSRPIQTFSQVLGASALFTPSLTPSATPAPTASPSALPAVLPLVTKKQSYTVALLGDSMIETLGSDLPTLSQQLKLLYPTTSFTLLNYGAGGKNINDGLKRITQSYIYNGKTIPSLASQKPDIVVIESFAYNPYDFEEGALDTHWLALSYIVDILKAELPEAKIIIAITIAPNSITFADGVPAIALDSTQKQLKTQIIRKYLENAIKFAVNQNLPLADAYNASLNESRNGKDEYISTSDHIHYSEEGKKFFTSKIAEAIVSYKLLE